MKNRFTLSNILAAAFLVATIAIAAFAQNANQYNGVGGFNGGYGQPPITYSRNLGVATTNDSVGLVVQKPGTLTNDLIEGFAGSDQILTLNSNGALINIRSNGVTQMRAALGILSGVSTNTNVVFSPQFLAGTTPVVTVSWTNGNVNASIVATNVTYTNFVTTPFGNNTNQFNWTAVGIPNVTH